MQNDASEIDVQEGVGMPKEHSPGRVMLSTTHIFLNGKPGGGSNDRPKSQVTKMDTPLTEWHTYGVWWKDPETIIYYLDDHEVARQAPNGAIDKPMFMFFDTEQHHMRLPTAAELNDESANAMQVDWVRSYSLKQ